VQRHHTVVRRGSAELKGVPGRWKLYAARLDAGKESPV
jgi:hypothetical protein